MILPGDIQLLLLHVMLMVYIDTLLKKIYLTRIGGGEKNVIETKNYTLNDRVFNYS